MNYYVVVEGTTEKKVYKSWLGSINNNICFVDSIFEISNNHFSIISGGGYPSYLNTIKSACEDCITHGNIDLFVVIVDSEEESPASKEQEVRKQIDSRLNSIIIVQKFCIETWALGNKRIFSTSRLDEMLREYIKFYNVKKYDPEMIPSTFQEFGLNRASFSFQYLKKLLFKKNPKISYTKNNPTMLADPTFYDKIKKRHIKTKHLDTFSKVLTLEEKLINMD